MQVETVEYKNISFTVREIAILFSSCAPDLQCTCLFR